MHITRADDAVVFDIPGVRFTSFASPSRGSAQTCVWRIDVEPGLTSPEHHTLDQDEVFVVLEGTVRLTPDGEPLTAGDAAVVPAGEPIQLTNVGDGPARLHVAVRAGFSAVMSDGTPIGTPPWAA